jgi:hypothetical protein
MKLARHSFSLLLARSLVCCSAVRQQQAIVPRLIKFSGRATDAQGKVISSIAGASFAIYKNPSGGAPLWIETQNFQAAQFAQLANHR